MRRRLKYENKYTHDFEAAVEDLRAMEELGHIKDMQAVVMERAFWEWVDPRTEEEFKISRAETQWYCVYKLTFLNDGTEEELYINQHDAYGLRDIEYNRVRYQESVNTTDMGQILFVDFNSLKHIIKENYLPPCPHCGAPIHKYSNHTCAEQVIFSLRNRIPTDKEDELSLMKSALWHLKDEKKRAFGKGNAR